MNNDLQDFKIFQLYYDLFKRKVNLRYFNQHWEHKAEEIDEN